jgi:hypothetical protein
VGGAHHSSTCLHTAIINKEPTQQRLKLQHLFYYYNILCEILRFYILIFMQHIFESFVLIRGFFSFLTLIVSVSGMLVPKSKGQEPEENLSTFANEISSTQSLEDYVWI